MRQPYAPSMMTDDQLRTFFLRELEHHGRGSLGEKIARIALGQFSIDVRRFRHTLLRNELRVELRKARALRDALRLWDAQDSYVAVLTRAGQTTRRFLSLNGAGDFYIPTYLRDVLNYDSAEQALEQAQNHVPEGYKLHVEPYHENMDTWGYKAPEGA